MYLFNFVLYVTPECTNKKFNKIPFFLMSIFNTVQPHMARMNVADATKNGFFQVQFSNFLFGFIFYTFFVRIFLGQK